MRGTYLIARATMARDSLKRLCDSENPVICNLPESDVLDGGSKEKIIQIAIDQGFVYILEEGGKNFFRQSSSKKYIPACALAPRIKKILEESDVKGEEIL